MKNIFLFFSVFFLFVTLNTQYVLGQNLDGIGIAELYPLTTDAVPGSIISIDRETSRYALSKVVNDNSVIGVVVENPLLLFQTEEGGTPILRSGQTRVNVSTLNGPIFTGDFITSSSIPGRGQKASGKSIYALGIALEPFPPTNPDSQAINSTLFEGREVLLGDILVDLKINPSSAGLDVEGVDLSALERFDNTRTAIQIIIAAMLSLGSIFFAFRNVGSSIQNGILSVGRNPRARFSIQTTVFLHLFLVLAISSAGIFLSFIILSVPLF